MIVCWDVQRLNNKTGISEFIYSTFTGGLGSNVQGREDRDENR
jgi:hypothetical protein